MSLRLAAGAVVLLPLVRLAAAEDVGLTPQDVIGDATTYAVVASSSSARPSHAEKETPAPATLSVNEGMQRALSEMRERHILDPGAESWTSEDSILFGRIKEAEDLGAFSFIREQVGTLRGYAIQRKDRRAGRRWLLTKSGFQEYLFLKSQKARHYFEEQGTDAKFVFRLRNLDGKRIFDGRGVLTADGDALFNLILRGRTIQWKEPNGTVRSNVPRRPQGL